MGLLPDIVGGKLHIPQPTKKKKKQKIKKVFKKKYEVLGEGEPCPKCDKPMQRREHKNILDKQRNAPYYFREWDYCCDCKHLQHYDHCKVFNKNKAAKLYNHKRELAQHWQQANRLMETD